MSIGFYAGSFDPFTNGHLHVVKRAAKQYDQLILGIGINQNKVRRFDRSLMCNAIQKVLQREGLQNVRVITYDGYTVDAAKECQTTVLIRGFRNLIEYEDEEKIASANERISGLDTVYIRSGEYGFISSSYVMEIFNYGANISDLVPPEIEEIMLLNRKNSYES